MKNAFLSLAIVSVMLICFVGCGSENSKLKESNNDIVSSNTNISESTNNESEIATNKVSKPENKKIALTVTTKSDYNKLAMNFSELVKDADVILKIKVMKVSSFVADNAMIQTEITPQVQNIYKGVYNNEKLYVNGGEMLYDDFIKNDIIKNTISGHDSLNENYKGMYVQQKVDNQYIFNIGDEYIFFAKKREDSQRYYSLYAYQGTFKIVNNNIENSALSNDEPLKEDIYKSLGYELKSNASASKETSLPTTIASYKEFENKINNLK